MIYEYKATIINVYDGDSVTARVDLGFYITKTIKARLAHIDTPEIRGEERPDGLVSKQFVEDLILHKDVLIKTDKDKTGKYGRWIVEIFLIDTDETRSVNQILLDEGLAEPYNK